MAPDLPGRLVEVMPNLPEVPAQSQSDFINPQ